MTAVTDEITVYTSSLLKGDIYKVAVILKVFEQAATPATPNISQIYESTSPVAIFAVPVLDVDGNPISSSKLSYQFFSDVEEEISPITFSPDDYSSLTEETTVFPYGFTDNTEIYRTHIYLKQADYKKWNKIGLQSIYTGGGVENKSEIYWLTIKPYEKVDGVVTFRNFGLGRYKDTDYFNTTALTSDENNYVGFFRMKPQYYKSGYAYLRLAPGEFAAADGGEILVKPDTKKDIANGILSYSCEYKLTDGKAFDAAEAVGTAANPKGWWNKNAEPVGFFWAEYSMSWGNRNNQFGSSAGAKYFGEFEDDTDGIVKLVVPADSISNGEFYTLQGVKVAHPTKGVYIHNGKKVVIK